MGGIESKFLFVDYKIDKVELKLAPEYTALMIQQAPREDVWQFRCAIRDVLYVVDHRIYVSGLQLGTRLITKDHEDGTEPLLQMDIGISGIFKVEGDDFSLESEENIARVQFPTILMPYARAAATNILASAGYGSVVLPLFNIHEMLRQQGRSPEIKRISSHN